MQMSVITYDTSNSIRFLCLDHLNPSLGNCEPDFADFSYTKLCVRIFCSNKIHISEKKLTLLTNYLSFYLVFLAVTHESVALAID